MTQPGAALTLLDDVTCETRERLRESLARSLRDFEFYAERFQRCGVTPADISNDDPLELLQRLPVLESRDLHELAAESLSRAEGIVDMETSSGTTGLRKRRFISWQDDAEETKLLAKLFKVCGLDFKSRVACLDTDPLTLMASFTKALQLLGVQETYMYCVGSDFSGTLTNLPRLDPTVIITVPSIIERCIEVLKAEYSKRSQSSLEKIIFVGEPLPGHVRDTLENELGVEAFGYYGASETSALGIECADHSGIHIFTDHNIAEIASDNPESSSGEMVVTTLNQTAYPLIRYALKDLVRPVSGVCPCGLSYPRVHVLGRADGSVSILGAKMSYDAILNAIYGGSDHLGVMQMVLSRDPGEHLDIVLPHSTRTMEKEIRKSLLAAQPDLDFLVSSKHLDLSFSFVEESVLTDGRKTKRVIDARQHNDQIKI